MKRKQIRFFRYCLTMGIIAILTMVMASCSPTSTSTSTPITTSTPMLSSIVVASASTANLPVGFSQQLTATGTYADSSTDDITYQVTWISSDTNIATISYGLATGKTEGNTNITATLSGITSPVITLMIVPTPMLSSIAVTPTTPDNLEVRSTQQFTATGTYVEGSTNDITSQVTWASSDTNIATISSAGLATTLAVGSTNITAALSGIKSPVVTLIVQASTLSYIAVTPTTPTNLAVGFTVQFTAVGTYSDSSTANITSQVIWTSSDTTIATISSTGLATGKAEGHTNITAALSGITSQAVTLPVSILSSIAVSPASPADLAVGSIQAFKVIGIYSNGVNSLITSKVTWISSDTNVATISSDGLATALAVGSTNISVSLSGLTSPVVSLTVVAPAPTTSTTPATTP
jgi:hypothetical protein